MLVMSAIKSLNDTLKDFCLFPYRENGAYN